MPKTEENQQQKAPFRWSDRARSFRFAGQGIVHAFRVTHNFWIHASVAVVVVGLAWWLQVDKQDWGILILCIGLVAAAEVFNTALEELVDLLHPHRHPRAGRIKDLAAGAVLIAAIAAAMAGALILGPPLWEKLFA